MKKNSYKFLVLLYIGIMLQGIVYAQKAAIITIDKSATYQKITGYGGFVNSGTFAYDWMTADEIKKLWGKDSEAGYNIMRMYLPIGKDAWPQCLATAQLAKSLGVTLFASPWSMPATWKTNDTISATYKDSNNVAHVGYLKAANYADYANYLNDFVTYLNDNGVQLDAISIQNEPDMESTYAGCIWTPAQMATFIAKYGRTIKCKIIAPESVGIENSYATAFLPDSVSNNFDIFAGHQYGSLESGFSSIQAKGHETWMTEYLINWNSDENTTRDFNWAKDGFSFAAKLNTAMVSNVNAWIHYASKRFYGLMGDGLNGTTTGVMTKRGYILSHYAKYTIGTTRIKSTWIDDSGVLSGSSYLSVTGDSVIVIVNNSSSNSYTLTNDLPFYTTSGSSITTTEALNMFDSPISLSAETCRPKVTIAPLSVTTLIFIKSSERAASQMTGAAAYYNKIEDQTVTNTAFGTAYQMSGSKRTFDHSDNLISTNTTSSNGYLNLIDRYNKMVIHVDTIKSTSSYSAGNATLYYVNNSGTVNSINYGNVSLPSIGNFDWSIDLSRTALTDGCTGLVGITCSNYSSILTIKFGDVYFKLGSEKMYKFGGAYSKGDSNFLNCLDDSTYTSLDFTGTTGITSDQDWNASAANKNCIFYVDGGVTNDDINVISGTNCSKLTLSDAGGNFYVPVDFTTTAASYSRTFDGYGVMVLPFNAYIPSGVQAYTMLPSATDVTCTQITNMIPANTPVLINGTGTFTFTGSGTVSTPHALTVNNMNGVYVSVKAPYSSTATPVNSYYLKTVDGVTGFYPVVSGAEPTIMPFSAYLSPSSFITTSYLPLTIVPTGIDQIKSDSAEGNNIYYDVSGRRVYQPQKGNFYIKDGKKVIY